MLYESAVVYYIGLVLRINISEREQMIVFYSSHFHYLRIILRLMNINFVDMNWAD